jgi:hypothetical protein
VAVGAAFVAMVVVGVVACAVAWALGSHEEILYLSGLSGIPPYRIVLHHFLPDTESLGFVLFLLFPGGYLLAIFGPAVVRRTLHLWRASRDRRRWQLPLATTLDGAPDGRWVRVRGQVARGVGFTSAGGRSGVVIASCLGSVGDVADRRRRTRYFWELHGTDFRVTLERGEEVAIRVENATLLDRPARISAEVLGRRPFSPRVFDRGDAPPSRTQIPVVACVYDEQAIAAGDWVEVAGLLSRRVDPAAEAVPRGARLQPQLESTPSGRLLIRAVAGAEDGCR